MKRLVHTGLASIVVFAAACGSTPVAPPVGDTSPPVVSVTASGGELRGSFSTTASDGQSSITAHRLYLNGTLVRSSASGAALTVTDTTLAPGSYTVRGEATSSGGTGSNSTTFTVTSPVVPSPPTASIVTSVIDEAATGTVNLLGFTTGQANRTISIQAPASLDATLANGQLTYKARDNGPTTWDDVNGTFAISYTVTDANGIANGTVNITITAQPDLTYTLREVGDSNQALTNLTFRANGVDFTAPPAGGKIQLKTGANTLELKSNANWRDLQVWLLDGKIVPLNQNDTQYALTLSSADLVGTLKALHATIHPQYRAGAQSETDVRAAYWDGNAAPNLKGFIGRPTTPTTIYVVRNTQSIGGVSLCDNTSQQHIDRWVQAINLRNQENQTYGSMRGAQASVVDQVPAGTVVLQSGLFNYQNNTGTVCDKSTGPSNRLYSNEKGQFFAYSADVPSNWPAGGEDPETQPEGDRTFGEASGQSTWIRAASSGPGGVPRLSDVFIKKYIHTLADAAYDLGWKPIKF